MKTPRQTARRDMVVVLARGRAVRMGQPKAGLRLPDDDRPFLARIIDLYAMTPWPLVVVTGPGGRPSCLEASRGRPVTIVEGPDAGDTALTLLTARRHAATISEPVTHWWAHPVDVPLVTRKTLASLQSASVGDPDRVVRPTCADQIGHPVVIPARVLEHLEKNERWHTAPLRHFLEHRIRSGHDDPVRTVPVQDPGVVQDFDEPADLQAWHLDKNSQTRGCNEET